MICLATAAAATDLPLFESNGLIRDVVRAIESGDVYIASTETGEVICVPGTTRHSLLSFDAGRAPSALAVSGEWLAALSPPDGILTIIHTPSRTVYRRIELEAGGSKVFAESEHAFGVVNPIERSVRIVDVRGGAPERLVPIESGVPIDAVAVGDRTAVLLRSPDEVRLFDRATLELVRTLKLQSPMDTLAGWDSSSVALQSGADLAVADTHSGRIVSRYRLPEKIWFFTPAGIVVQNGQRSTEYRWIDRGLREVYRGRSSGYSSGAAIASGGSLYWQARPGAVWAEDPARTAARNTAIEAAMADPDRLVELDAGTSPSSSYVMSDEVAKVEKYKVAPSPTVSRGRSPHAPRFGGRSGEFNAAFERALAIGGEEGSLLNTDWNFETLENARNAGEVVRDGNRFTITDTEFEVGESWIKTDRFEIDAETGEFSLEGGVEIEQTGSTLRADSLSLTDTEPEWEGKELPLVPSRGSKGAAHPLVPDGRTPEDFAPRATQGTLHISNFVWKEHGIRELTGDTLDLDLATMTGTIRNTHGAAGPLYFGTDELELNGPGNAHADKLWISTCELPVPHYRLRLSNFDMWQNRQIVARNMRLQVGPVQTPVYYPRYSVLLKEDKHVMRTEIDFGSRADLGTVLEFAQWFKATEHADLAPRLYATTREGTGLGLDGRYDLMNAPAATFFRSEGEFHTLYTTEERGYVHWYHRQELTPDTTALVQTEQWSDVDFYKEFYNGEYGDRTGPRSFLNITRTQPHYISSATLAPSLNSFTRETEKMPELSFQMLERRAAGNLYGAFETVGGYYYTEPGEVESARLVTVGRLSYDWNAAPGFNVLPFVEVDGTFYSRTLNDGNEGVRGSLAAGMTLQARLQRSFKGVREFTGFKHLIIPSSTIFYRPNTTLDAEDTPRFDDLDDRPERFRIENTIDNILLGKNASTGTVWPVARMTLYHGHDFYNESSAAADYELEIEIRPRPWWGLNAQGEIHDIDDDLADPGEDYSRVLAYLFFDNELGKNNFNGRIGFAYTEAGDDTLNQEVIYGAGYRLNENWAIAFEQRYDFNLSELTRQTYELRRRLHKWEMLFSIRDRQRGVDIGLGFSLSDFPNVGVGL